MDCLAGALCPALAGTTGRKVIERCQQWCDGLVVGCVLFAGCTCRGPFSDRFGRRVTYNICTVVYIGTTLGCVFSPNIGVLIAMRALQGFAREYLGWRAGNCSTAFCASSMLYRGCFRQCTLRPKVCLYTQCMAASLALTES